MKEKKKIYLFINSLRGGGAEKVCVNLANSLTGLGYNVTLCVLSLRGAVYEQYLNSDVELVNLGTEHTRKSAFKVFKFIKKRKPGLILSFNHQISILLTILRMINISKYKIISRNINMLSSAKKEKKNFWHKHVTYLFIKIFYGKVDRIIAQSNLMKKDLVEEFNLNAKKIKVINNPIDKRIEEDMKKNNPVQLEKNNKNILFVGRLTKQKGLDYLLEAFKKCAEIDQDISLKIVGEGPLKEWVGQQVNKLELSTKVEMKNFTNDIINEYRKASLVVLSSRFEGFPNVLIEAISLGIPVVSFDCPSGPRDIIIERKNGLLVENANSERLAEKILEALNMSWDSSEIVYSSKRFSTININKKYDEIIKELI